MNCTFNDYVTTWILPATSVLVKVLEIMRLVGWGKAAIYHWAVINIIIITIIKCRVSPNITGKQICWGWKLFFGSWLVYIYVGVPRLSAVMVAIREGILIYGAFPLQFPAVTCRVRTRWRYSTRAGNSRFAGDTLRKRATLESSNWAEIPLHRVAVLEYTCPG